MRANSQYKALLAGSVYAEDWSPEECLTLDAMDLDQLSEREAELIKEINLFDRIAATKRKPFDLELERVKELKQQALLAQQNMGLDADEIIEAPGPAYMDWVDTTWFAALCNFMVASNLIAMAIAPTQSEYQFWFRLVDQIFLVWYVFELGAKYWYWRMTLFLGPIRIVWWNWLDMGIVISGIIDQWIVPCLLHGVEISFSTNSLRSLRLLRLFRILRVLKLARTVFGGDFSWAASPQFEAFMSMVIAINAILMSIELDYEWPGWIVVENGFLIIYLTELFIRLKREGCSFFYNTKMIFWNYLDTTIVIGGIVDLWCMPAVMVFRNMVLNQDVSDGPPKESESFTSLLKLMRMLRVLRLVRLLHSVKPLYRLLLGVIESFKAMQWVMILTFVMLYAGGIFWTSVVGKGLFYDEGEVPLDVSSNFGSVPRSMFSLFRLMNGDTDVVEPIMGTAWGDLLFIGFMVLSNWAILAILTSVVSDNMISSSRRIQDEDAERKRTMEYVEKADSLRRIFSEVDADGSGAINEEEWHAMMRDPHLRSALCEATEMTQSDLDELFRYLAVEPRILQREISAMDPSISPLAKHLNLNPRHDHAARLMHYTTFVEHLRDDSQPADKRSILRILSRMQAMEGQMDRRLDEIWEYLKSRDAHQGRPRAGDGSFTKQIPSVDRHGTTHTHSMSPKRTAFSDDVFVSEGN